MFKHNAHIQAHLSEIRSSLDSYLALWLPQDLAAPSAYSAPQCSKNQPDKSRYKPRSSARIHIPDFLRPSARQKLDEVLENKQESFSEMLLRMIDEKDLKDSDVYKNANIDRRLFSKIRGDKDYLPSKKTAISFCLALRLNINEASSLLKAAGYSLSASSRFDLIIRFLIEQKEYDVHFANIILNDYGEGSLSR